MKAIRHQLENSDGEYEAVARRKQLNRRSDCVHTVEYIEHLPPKKLEDPGIGIMALSRDFIVQP